MIFSKPPRTDAVTPLADRLLAREHTTWWSLLLPYWVSEEAVFALACLVAKIALSYAGIYFQVWRNSWTGRFYDAIGARQVDAFGGLFGTLLMALAISSTTLIVDLYLGQVLVARWRAWLTQRLVGAWTRDGAFYRIERDRRVENPDQRLSEDVSQLIQQTVTIFFALVSVPVSAVSFSVVLYRLSGNAHFTAGGMAVTIPAYMVIAAFVYSGGTLLLTHLSGRKMIPLNAEIQHREADFRFGLMQIREHAEQIAFMRGGDREAVRVMDSFEAVRRNMWEVIRITRRINIVTFAFGDMTTLVPTLLILPAYLARKIALGGMMQLSSAFGSVTSTLSYFPQAYQSFALWRAIVNRLRLLNDEIRHREQGSSAASRIALVQSEGNEVGTPGVTLTTSSGAVISQASGVTFKAGERWLVRGPSGSGKSTLFRALAGLWPYGSGTVNLPPHAGAGKVEFLPQRSYVPTGTLKAALCYPDDESRFDDAACEAALRDAGLADFTTRLHESQRWSSVLSGGEGQRVAIARAMLREADFLFLDEATSGLDEATERRVYRALLERLPHAAIISISHHASLAEQHDHFLDLSPHVAADGPSTPARSQPVGSTV